jgi:hypothetical protein
VLGRRGERHVEGRGQLADIALALRQPAQHGAAGGIGERVEHAVEGRGVF